MATRKRVGLLAATALLAGALSLSPISAGASPGPCSGPSRPSTRAMVLAVGTKEGRNSLETVTLRTFHVVVKADRKAYRIGQTAKMTATVTRPAHEDPFGEGVQFDPPASFPAEDVVVGVGLSVGDVYLYGHGTTKANGKAVIKVKIAPYTPPGKAAADLFARKTQLRTICASVEEVGYKHEANLFNVIGLAR
ncbi:MAG: hypothetical protein ACRDJS_05745 [Actinomycetota bacterium]